MCYNNYKHKFKKCRFISLVVDIAAPLALKSVNFFFHFHTRKRGGARGQQADERRREWERERERTVCARRRTKKTRLVGNDVKIPLEVANGGCVDRVPKVRRNCTTLMSIA